jgi:hypothetical protein
MPAQKRQDLPGAPGNLRLSDAEIVACSDVAQRPECEISRDLMLGQTFDFDETIPRTATGKAVADEQAGGSEPDGQEQGRKDRTFE